MDSGMLRIAATALWLLPAAVAAQPVAPDPDGVQRIRVVAGEYFFKPAKLVVRANLPVELVVVKEKGMVPHDLVIDAPAAGIKVKEELSTEEKRVRFTPTGPGVYPLHCSRKLLFLASHRERGMEGTLEVVP